MHNWDLILIAILVYLAMAVLGINQDDIDFIIRDAVGAYLPV